jgi:hypothetical protein
MPLVRCPNPSSAGRRGPLGGAHTALRRPPQEPQGALPVRPDDGEAGKGAGTQVHPAASDN